MVPTPRLEERGFSLTPQVGGAHPRQGQCRRDQIRSGAQAGDSETLISCAGLGKMQVQRKKPFGTRVETLACRVGQEGVFTI